MKVLITGSLNGQLRAELERSCPSEIDLVSQPEPRLDITNAEAVQGLLAQHKPQVVINAAAYTAVDRAESERDKAFSVNADGVEILAKAATAVGARLIHVSTESVFGISDGMPFTTGAMRQPLSVYGASKLEGERKLAEIMPDSSLIVRTAWVYSSVGSNFVKTMLHLMQSREEISVVADQIGTPTWAHNLAHALWRATELDEVGVMHWTGAGVASWYDFAVAIYEEATALELLNKDVDVRAIRSDQYPMSAKRPSFGVMDTSTTQTKLQMRAVHWRKELRLMLRELK